MKIDPRSDRIVLYYTGDESGEPSISGVPARDLHENDIARLVYIEHAQAVAALGPADEVPELDVETSADEILERLLEGPYAKTAPAPDKAPPKATVPRGTSDPSQAAPPADSAEGEKP